MPHVFALQLLKVQMSHLPSTQAEGRKGGDHAGFAHLSGSGKQTLSKGLLLQIPSEVSLAKTCHMAAPSCKRVWETGMGSMCLAQPSHDLSTWSWAQCHLEQNWSLVSSEEQGARQMTPCLSAKSGVSCFCPFLLSPLSRHLSIRAPQSLPWCSDLLSFHTAA